MISDVFAPATEAQRIAGLERVSRVSAVMTEAAALRHCTPESRAEQREKIRAKLTECDVVARQRAELNDYRRQLEVERDQAIENHAIEAAKIQAKLADPSLSVQQRLEARQELGVINAALVQAIADIEQRDAACESEAADLEVVLSARSILERAMRDTCDPELLAKLETAERTRKRLQRASIEADKAARETPSAQLTADAQAMGAIAAAAATDCDRLTRQMLES